MYVVLLLLIFSPQLLQKDVIWLTAVCRLEDISLVVDELYSVARSSAYKARWMLLGMLSEMSLKKRLNSVGDKQLPCGTPVLVV